MRVLKDGVGDYGTDNERFNKAAGPIVGEIFQTQDAAPVGYIFARPSRREPRDWKPSSFVQLIRQPYSVPKKEQIRFDLSGLGEYERVIFSCIAWGDYPTYVLTGEMGSGKSTTTRLIRTILERQRLKTCGICEKCDPVIITLDFNEGFRIKNTQALVRKFHKSLYNKLRSNLRKLFTENALADALLEEIAKEGADDAYAAFDIFAQEHEEDVSGWNAKSLRERANAVFNFVDSQATSDEERVELVMPLVRLTKETLRADSACLVFFFDNVDSIWPEAQYEILVEIMSYMTLARAKALVVLRRSTFERLQNQAAFSFGCIEHLGPDVSEVIRKRVEYYRDNWDKTEKFQVLRPDYQEAIKRRLNYILRTAGEPLGALTEIAYIAGASVRLGLFASERLIINGAVPYDEDPRNLNDLRRAILVGVGTTPGITPDDHCVANLFLNRMTGRASLLNLRILQLVQALADDISKRNVLTLLVMLKHIGNWGGEEVRRALNYLLYMRRPLLWIDGKAEYESVSSMQNSDDVLYLTEAGHYYLKNLCKDLTFVQQASLDVEWPTRWMPKGANYAVAVDRFRLLRGALRELLEQDLTETRRFKKWIRNGRTEFGLPLVLVTNRILASIGRSALRILMASTAPQTTDEIIDWLSLINIGLEHERTISSSCKSLDKLSRDYTELLNVVDPSRARRSRNLKRS